MLRGSPRAFLGRFHVNASCACLEVFYLCTTILNNHLIMHSGIFYKPFMCFHTTADNIGKIKSVYVTFHSFHIVFW